MEQNTSFIYLIKNSEESHYKIGVAKNPKRRLKQLQTGSSAELILIETYKTEMSYMIEKVLHRMYSHFHKEGEWFNFSITEQYDFLKNCETIEKNIKSLVDSGNVFI